MVAELDIWRARLDSRAGRAQNGRSDTKGVGSLEIVASLAIAAAVTLVITFTATTEVAPRARAPRGLLAPPEAFANALAAFRTMIARWNAGDAAGAAACVHEDAIFRGGPLLPETGCTGREAIAGFLEQSIANQFVCSVAEGRSSSIGVGGRMEVRSDRIARCGIDRVRFSYYAESKDGLIAMLRLTADINDRETAQYVEYVRSLRMRGEDAGATAGDGALGAGDEPVDAVIVGEYRTVPDDSLAALGDWAPQRRRLIVVIAMSVAALGAVWWLALRRRGGQAPAPATDPTEVS